MIDEAVIIKAWCEAVCQHYTLAKGERLGELRGRRPRTIDERGLHPLSLEVGRILALQEMLPDLELLEFTHLLSRKAAHNDAANEYEQEIVSKWRHTEWPTSQEPVAAEGRSRR
jgi:hypothetical protein